MIDVTQNWPDRVTNYGRRPKGLLKKYEIIWGRERGFDSQKFNGGPTQYFSPKSKYLMREHDTFSPFLAIIDQMMCHILHVKYTKRVRASYKRKSGEILIAAVACKAVQRHLVTINFVSFIYYNL